MPARDRMRRRAYRSRFDDGDIDPLSSMANLADVMLVFACGLLAALTLHGAARTQLPQQPAGGIEVEQGRELPEVPEQISSGSSPAGDSGYKPVGRVYRDAQTGKLILIGEATR